MIEKVVVGVHWERTTKLEKKLQLSEKALKMVEEKIKVIVAKATKEKSAMIVEAIAQAMEEFKASKGFKVEIAKGSMVTYGFSLNYYKA